MIRLLDADKFKEYATYNATVTVDGERVVEPDSVIENFLLSYPPVDPVHAAGGVYCRECQFCSPSVLGYEYSCNVMFDGRKTQIPTKADGFCSCGKRKEDEHG